MSLTISIAVLGAGLTLVGFLKLIWASFLYESSLHEQRTLAEAQEGATVGSVGLALFVIGISGSMGAWLLGWSF